MTLIQSTVDAAALKDFVFGLSRASGEIIRSHFRSGYSVDTKSDLSPVTIADRSAELELRRLIMAEYPDHGILGEEFGTHQPDARYQWVLDPIDGTKNFISHSYLFGTLIALLDNGRPILGAIHHPVTDDFILGDGKQTWLNGAPTHVRPCESIEKAVILSSSYTSVRNHADGDRFDALIRRAWLFRTWGDCHGYGLVAIGGADVMLDPIMSVWDLMALIPIIEGAGGRITDWQGNDSVKGKSAIATAGGIHEDVLRAVNG